jgi:hypothetical protein
LLSENEAVKTMPTVRVSEPSRHASIRNLDDEFFVR